jgi:hypothetical protein
MSPEDGTSRTLLRNEEPMSQENAPAPKRRSVRLQAIIAILMLVCIVVGGFLIVKSGSPSSSTPGTAAGPLPKPWCAAPDALAGSFSGTSISGLGPNDVWSIGLQVMHWNGKVWNTVYTPSSTQYSLRSVTEIATNSVWVTGEQLTNGLASHPFTIHWDGSNWHNVGAPDAAKGGKNSLVAVSGISNDDVWAVGFYVPQEGPIGVLAEHWDGSKWSVEDPQDAPIGAQFTGIKAVSSNDVWAVGYASTIQSGKTVNQPLTEHWNGSKWASIANPNLTSAGGGNLYNIGGSSSNDLWAVGGSNQQMLTEHWDGKSWTLISSPSVGPDSSNWLSGVAALATDNVWAVGRVAIGGHGFQPFVEHWDGHQWITSQDPTQGAGELDGVTTVGNQVWIVGIPNSSGGHSFVETLCP